MERTVLCYIKQNDSYLMLLRNKRKNDINEGKWIGVGGHIEKNETEEEALLREVFEETGLTLLDFKLKCKVHFLSNGFEEESYVYTSNCFKGNLKECDEGTLQFIKEKDIFDLNLWEGDRIFLPKVFSDSNYFELKLYYENGKLVKVS